jgi:hypothetical protein
MIGLLTLIIVGTDIWVYFDARQRDWPQAPGGGLHAAWSWTLACVLLWIVGFPVYLMERKGVPTIG